MPQLNLRVSDEQLAAIDAAISRVHVVDDPVGLRSDYVRDAAVVAARVESHTRSMRIVAERYLEVCRRARPRLSPAEWRCVLDACNGLWLADTLSVSAIPFEVADAIRISALDQKHECDGPGLVSKLAALDYAALVALANVVEIWWGDGKTVAGPVPGEEGWTEERTAIP